MWVPPRWWCGGSICGWTNGGWLLYKSMYSMDCEAKTEDAGGGLCRHMCGGGWYIWLGEGMWEGVDGNEEGADVGRTGTLVCCGHGGRLEVVGSSSLPSSMRLFSSQFMCVQAFLNLALDIL